MVAVRRRQCELAMPYPVLLGASAGGGRFLAAKPTLTYSGSGAFTIGNYDASYVYSVSGGTRSGNVITVSGATGTATVTARPPKGLTASASASAERKAPDQYYVVTSPFQCYHSASCASQCGGCGTYYAQDAWNPNDGSAQGFYSCCDQRVYYYNNYSSSGYSWSGSNYTNGSGEWWKIS